jgi:hypothetical protein
VGETEGARERDGDTGREKREERERAEGESEGERRYHAEDAVYSVDELRSPALDPSQRLPDLPYVQKYLGCDWSDTRIVTRSSAHPRKSPTAEKDMKRGRGGTKVRIRTSCSSPGAAASSASARWASSRNGACSSCVTAAIVRAKHIYMHYRKQ